MQDLVSISVLVARIAQSVKAFGLAIAFLATYVSLRWLPQPHAF
jgi:hypothetical protein